ncbi:L-histidine N(alpha)-methyltransferase [Kushneria phosphatilytica]|uniref:L-histidine N(Alpha)-methyltransferase n=1 Tax=Kushneria phosphatilytica TaxID=657387 RepID=A0A1S1NSI2_9GAMM|nr:L-histidine N(alpha)-methyltransferase [Kushneria phosphatilytica]OHV08033.1 dimethylhistidine N-methyltransferase [Kushneria phosphatilytica]QEL09944.1 L-histidine N(alpha)-methyltransferase [Kushneria phosphatilytica]
MARASASHIHFHDLLADSHTATSSLLEDALQGLSEPPRTLPPKHFYDQRGSELFDRICEQPEYYPTRTEESILEQALPTIAKHLGQETTLIELGSGASRKIRLLLNALRPQRYVGIDISRDFLIDSTEQLAADHPWLDVHALCADFTTPLTLPAQLANSERPVAFFPGSSIGNFAPDEASVMLGHLRNMLPVGGGLLIGVDMIKSPAILEAAYNDAAGVTAEFNRNLICRLRDELGAEIDPADFDHRAFYNSDVCRIEMHLVSRRDQRFMLGETPIALQQGESIHTEDSWKYSDASFEEMAGQAGFAPVESWHDPEGLFGVYYFTRAA